MRYQDIAHGIVVASIILTAAYFLLWLIVFLIGGLIAGIHNSL